MYDGNLVTKAMILSTRMELIKIVFVFICVSVIYCGLMHDDLLLCSGRFSSLQHPNSSETALAPLLLPVSLLLLLIRTIITFSPAGVGPPTFFSTDCTVYQTLY